MQKKYVLPHMEYKFSITIVGEESRIRWVGDFLYRRPTLRERSAIDALHKRLNGDLTTLQEDVAALNEALAFLRFTLKDYPNWWKDSDMGGALYDANVIIEIYNRCMAFEAEWRKKTMGGDPAKVEDGNTEEFDLASASPSL
jgi:hypothetical protein